MIDVSNKITTLRSAKAEGYIKLKKEIIQKVLNNEIEKGDVFEVSRVAGIQAAKKTSELLIFCHNLPLEWVDLDFNVEEDQIRVTSEAVAISRTGVEMEALTATGTALLNIYDMLKPYDKEMEIRSIRLLEKKGGKSDYEDKFDHPVKAALIRISDGVADGSRDDNSTSAVEKILSHHSVDVVHRDVIRSEENLIREMLTKLADGNEYHFIFTIGATGLGDGNLVSEITENLVDYEIPGIAEAMRGFGRERTPYAIYSRITAGVRGETIIINLPGSSRGATESVHALFPGLKHALLMMNKGKLRKI